MTPIVTRYAVYRWQLICYNNNLIKNYPLIISTQMELLTTWLLSSHFDVAFIGSPCIYYIHNIYFLLYSVHVEYCVSHYAQHMQSTLGWRSAYCHYWDNDCHNTRASKRERMYPKECVRLVLIFWTRRIDSPASIYTWLILHYTWIAGTSPIYIQEELMQKHQLMRNKFTLNYISTFI